MHGIHVVYTLYVCLFLLAIDDCGGASSGGVVQSYEDLVRNYVVSMPWF